MCIRDSITHLDGKAIQDMAQVKIATALGRDGAAVAMTVRREGEAQPLIFDIVARASEDNEGLLSAGVYPAETLTLAESADPDRAGRAAVSPRGPLIDLPLKPGMQLAAVNGRPIDTPAQYHRAVVQTQDPLLALTFSGNDGETIEGLIPAWPSLTRHGDSLHLLGLQPVATVSPTSPKTRAAKAGVEKFDVVAKIGDTPWPTLSGLVAAVRDDDDGPLAVTVLRGDQTLALKPVTPRFGKIGVGLSPTIDSNRVGGVLPDSPFARASADRPLPPGSQLSSVDGRPVRDWVGFQHAVMQRLAAADAGQPVAIELDFKVNLGDSWQEQYRVELTAQEARALRSDLSWKRPSGIVFEPLMAVVKADNAVHATVIGAQKTKEFIQQTYITLLRLVQGSIGVKNLRGPVGIVDQGAKVARQGFAYFLFFLGLISVNLAVLNFLPIPIVDGGHMVFLIIEKLKGSPASPQVQVAVSLVALVGLACIFLYVTFNDISRIVTG